MRLGQLRGKDERLWRSNDCRQSAAVRPGYHQDKRHWNTVELGGSINDDELREMIDHPYEHVVRTPTTHPADPPLWRVIAGSVLTTNSPASPSSNQHPNT